jgi:hypothetical protein
MKLIKTLIKRYKKSIILEVIILFLFTFTVYIYNLSPSVFGGDSGDFLSAIVVKGVPHPSGYPLYTMLGILFNSLPIKASVAWKVGLVSSLFSSISVVLMYLITHELIENRYLAFITSLTLAFLYPFWLYTEVTEVFALHSFFILTLIYISIKYSGSKKDKYLYLLSFIVGFSLTNNLVIVLIFPALFIFIALINPKISLDFKLIARCVLFLLLGLTPYIYIPIAASFNPSINWGNATTLEKFMSLVLRHDYGWGLKASTNYSPLYAFKRYIYYWLTYITPIIPITSIAGIAYFLIKKKYKLLTFLSLALFFSGPFYFAYVKLPTTSLSLLGVLERFTIQSAIFIIILFPFGVISFTKIIQLLVKRKNLKKFLINVSYTSFSVVPVMLFLTNNYRVNLSNVHIGDNFGKDILSSLPKDSVLLVSTDSVAFNSLYVQYGLNFRKDILIPGRNTGYQQLLNITNLSQESGKDLDIDKLIRKNAINQELYYKSLVKLAKKEKAFSENRLEVTFDDEKGKIISIPHGLVFKLIYEEDFNLTKKEYLKQQENIWTDFQLANFTRHKILLSENLILSDIRRRYDFGLRHLANFMYEYYQDEEMEGEYIKKASELNPTFPALNLPIKVNKEIDNLNIIIFRNN